MLHLKIGAFGKKEIVDMWIGLYKYFISIVRIAYLPDETGWLF